jgi:hypothetical protein
MLGLSYQIIHFYALLEGNILEKMIKEEEKKK